MSRWGMVIDLDRCTACQACTVACRAENNVPAAGAEEAMKGRAIFWNDMLVYREGKYPHTRVRHVRRPCMQCENPACTKVCPVNATYPNPEGIVAQIWNRCIGCRLCMCACPYGARSFNWFHAEWPKQKAWAPKDEKSKVMDQYRKPNTCSGTTTCGAGSPGWLGRR